MSAPLPTSRRAAARLAAVQALYQLSEGAHEAREVIDQFVSVRTTEAGEGGMRPDADRGFFGELVEGSDSHRAELQPILEVALAGRTWDRVDRLVKAILLAAAYELRFRPDVPARVAINEYVEIAHDFFDQGEPGFINSVLDRVARTTRAAEFGP